MKKLFSTRVRVIAAVAVVLAALAAILTVSLSGRAGILKNAVGVIVTPVRAVVTAAATTVEQLYDYMYKYDALATENELLKQQLAEMERDIYDAAEIAEENAMLRELLGLKERNSDYEYVGATVISFGSSNWVNTLTIGKGTSSGVDVNMSVITAMGDLVGVVTEVSLTSATVSTVVDINTQIGATVVRCGEIGIAEGDYELMRQGLLRVNYISHDAELRNGDRIETTGGGSVYPKGLLIGYIVDVQADPSGLNKLAVIEPAADLSSLSQVFVVTNFTDVE